VDSGPASARAGAGACSVPGPIVRTSTFVHLTSVATP